MIFDYDDAVFLRDSYSGKSLESAIRRRRFAATVHAADAVVAGNDFLSAEAVRCTAPDRIHFVPTCVEQQAYPQARHQRGGTGVQLVWIGSTSTLNGLERCRLLLETIGRKLARSAAQSHLRSLSRVRQAAGHPVPVGRGDGGPGTRRADIGISWLPDDDWSRGKCGLKVIQYLAAGLPVVANRVGVQAEMVRHGETGYLADTPAQWIEAIRRLANDPVLRQRLGRNGRKLVQERDSVAGAGQSWLRVLDALPWKAVA